MAKTSWLARRMDETVYVWVFLIFADLFIMAFRTSNMSAEKSFILGNYLCLFSFFFILIRKLKYFYFFRSRRINIYNSICNRNNIEIFFIFAKISLIFPIHKKYC